MNRTSAALTFLGVLVLADVFFTVIKTGMNLSGMALLYPYASAILLLALFGVRRAAVRIFPALLAGALILLGSYHRIVLKEPLREVLYPLHFYFGMFLLFYGFTAFLFWLDADAARVRRWLVHLTETVAVLSFFLTALEYLGILSSWVQPSWFWWIRKQDVADLAYYQAEHLHTAVRAYGLSSNPSVLASFSVFLTVYYWSLVEGALRGRNIFIILCGLATVFMSMSGTGLFLLIAVFAALSLRGWGGLGVRERALRAGLFAAVILFALWLQLGVSGRLSAHILSVFRQSMGQSFGVFLGFMRKHPLNPLYGATVDLAGTSFYDFAILALVLELGLVGLAAYVVSLLSLMISAFPRENFLARLSVLTLLAGSSHYPVCFWMCSKAMLAVILSGHFYMRRRA